MNILAVPDLHIPYHHEDYLLFIKEYKKWADKVVFMGDIVDQHALGRWPKDPDLKSAGDEIEASLEALAALYALFPGPVDVCLGNHESRGLKSALNAGIPRIFIREVKEVFRFPDAWNLANEHSHDGVLYWHGDGLSGPTALAKSIQIKHQSNVFGHCHSNAGTLCQTIKTGKNFSSLNSLNTGCLVDLESYAFAYGEKAAHKPTLGLGRITDGEKFYFEPML